MGTTFQVDLPAPQTGVVKRTLTASITDPATGTPVNQDIPVALADLVSSVVACPNGATVKATWTDTDALGQSGSNSATGIAPLPPAPVLPPAPTPGDGAIVFNVVPDAPIPNTSASAVPVAPATAS